jgi:hypothetical protein
MDVGRQFRHAPSAARSATGSLNSEQSKLSLLLLKAIHARRKFIDCQASIDYAVVFDTNARYKAAKEGSSSSSSNGQRLQSFDWRCGALLSASLDLKQGGTGVIYISSTEWL